MIVKYKSLEEHLIQLIDSHYAVPHARAIDYIALTEEEYEELCGCRFDNPPYSKNGELGTFHGERIVGMGVHSTNLYNINFKNNPWNIKL